MTPKEKDKIWKKFLAQRDKKSKQKLIEYYFCNLVKKIAKNLVKKFKYRFTADELASHGTEGLYRAIDAYDPSRGAKFETYAYPRIWGSVIDAMREEDWVPRSVRQRQATIETMKNKMETDKGIRVCDIDAAHAAGFDLDDFQKNHNKFYAASCSSIESSSSSDIDENDNKKDFNKYLMAKNDSVPEENIIKKEFFSKLVGKNFTPLERKIIYHYYYNGFSMTEISKKFDMSESKISQIHQSILKKLKNKISVNPKYFEEDHKVLSRTIS
jgi:RNA polymerase sigma factor for flagellar operon FliA